MHSPPDITPTEAAQEARFSLALGALDIAVQRAGGNLPPSYGRGGFGRFGIMDALADHALQDRAAHVERWEQALTRTERTNLVLHAELVAAIYCALLADCQYLVRNAAAPTATPSREELEAQFKAVIDAYDKCIKSVHDNSVRWYDYVGGALHVFADKSHGEDSTSTLRTDRARLLTKWSQAKTDEERAALVVLARRWYEAGAFGAGGCKGVVPSLAETMVNQAGTYVRDAKNAAKDAGKDLLKELAKPLLYGGIAFGGLIVLTNLLSKRQ